MIWGLAGGLAVLTTGEVHAQGFLEHLFGTSRYYEGRPRYYERWEREELRRKRATAAPVRIKSPKYYTYRPDIPKTASFASLAKVKLASAKQTDATAAEPAGQPPVEPVVVTPVAVTPFDEARGHLSSLRLRMLPQVAKAIVAHYQASPRFIWISDGRINARARAAMDALNRADGFGLSPGDYRIDLPREIDIALGFGPDARQKALMRFEMELSAKALTYVLDATRGRIDPNKLSGYHDLPRKKVDLGEALGAMARADKVGAYLDSRNPDNRPFNALHAELAKLRGKDEAKRVEIAPGTLLKPGASSRELVNVVAAIRLRGTDKLKADHSDTLWAYEGGETYTPKLVALVRDFQRQNKLRADGIVGKQTIRALTPLSNKEKINKVIRAMERARWLPRQLGSRHVFINQPAYQASYMHDGQTPLTMRVVVGKKSNQTNFFYDVIETVEYNPYWGVPLSIIVNEMLPKLSRDPSYLDRIGYEVTTLSGERVSSSSVDWYGVADKSVSINVRQLPGKKNALGQVKILFPNKHNIYMHDTPAKSLFKRKRRAFSHGCVRLQNPRAMAAAVLGKTPGYITSRIARGKNEADKVAGKIPVYVAYFTAWPTPGGAVQYYADVYDRDKYLSRAMERTTSVRQGKG